MKKSLFSLALIASSLLAVQAATVQIDFGRSDATTEGALNMNYDNASASLGSMPGSVSLAWSTAGGYVSENGYTTTKTAEEEADWKNPFNGSMPFSLGDTFRDGLLTQTADGSGYFTVTFSGLAAGEYALSIFGGFTGKDVFAGQTWTIGNADASNAVWTSFGTDASGNWAEISSVTGDNSGVLTPGNAGTSSATANKGLYSSVENIVVGGRRNAYPYDSGEWFQLLRPDGPQLSCPDAGSGTRYGSIEPAGRCCSVPAPPQGLIRKATKPCYQCRS